MKTKIFIGDKYDFLEDEINSWMEKNPRMDIISTTQSSCQEPPNPKGDSESIVTIITIIYSSGPPISEEIEKLIENMADFTLEKLKIIADIVFNYNHSEETEEAVKNCRDELLELAE